MLKLTRTNERKVGQVNREQVRSSDDALGVAAWASRGLLVGRNGGGGVRDNAISVTAWASRSLLAGGDRGGDRDGAEGIH